MIDASTAAPANEYIQSATLNGASLSKPWFAESSILSGGSWEVQVGPEPNTNWAASPSDRPYSLSTGFEHVPNNPIEHPLAPTGKEAAAIWRYTTSQPASDWYKTAFDDSTWTSGPAGFGTDDEGVSPRTPWTKDDIWMRRTVSLAQGFHSPAVVAYHDQDIDVYINGVFAAHVQGWTHSYDVVSCEVAALGTLHTGDNIIAMHVHHPGDGRHFADAGLVELDWPENEK